MADLIVETPVVETPVKKSIKAAPVADVSTATDSPTTVQRFCAHLRGLAVVAGDAAKEFERFGYVVAKAAADADGAWSPSPDVLAKLPTGACAGFTSKQTLVGWSLEAAEDQLFVYRKN